MMRFRLFFLTLRRGSVQAVFLVAGLLIASCAPASVTQEPVVLPPTASAIDNVVVTETTVPNVEATQIPAVQPVATSRGADLHATDPTTVSLASGQYQLVEFFRFT